MQQKHGAAASVRNAALPLDQRRNRIISAPSESARYARQLALPGMKAEAQDRLLDSEVVILGVGGIGCACATYLAGAGVGTLILIDPEEVSDEDLNDQVLFGPDDVGQSKVEAARERLLAQNPNIEILTLAEPFTAHNADRILGDADLVIDAMGNWQAKLLASDICMQKNLTLVHGGMRGFEFHIYTMIPSRSACLRCVFSQTGLEDMASSSRSNAAFGPVTGMAGSFQAVEAVKLLAGLGTTPGNHMIKFDALRRDFDDVTDLGPQPGCPDCGVRFSG